MSTHIGTFTTHNGDSKMMAGLAPCLFGLVAGKTYKVTVEELETQMSINPTAYSMDGNWHISVSTIIVGDGRTIWEGKVCPRCKADDLAMLIEGVDVDTKKHIHTERCSKCFYSHYILVGGEQWPREI